MGNAHSNLEKFIRARVALEVHAAAATSFPSLDTSAGISSDGEKLENFRVEEKKAQPREREAVKAGA